MIARLRTFEDHASTVDEGTDRVWGEAVQVRSPIELQPFGSGSILILPQEVKTMDERDRVPWLAVIGAYVLRGGEIRWSLR